MTEEDILAFRNWVVIGDVLNEKKYAYRIANRLKSENYTVHQLNPIKKIDGTYNNLESLVTEGVKIDIIDLVITPRIGLGILKEAEKLGLKRVLIQPGAESEEVLDFCKENEFEYLQGCILRELNKKGK